MNMTEFSVPETQTKKVGEVVLQPAFRIMAQVEKEQITPTSRGDRLFQRIIGGTMSGPLLNGTLHPRSGGEFGLGRDDGAIELNTHFMARTEHGEMLYVTHTGIRRDADGYYRFTAYFDSEGDGPHAWLNDTLVVGTGRPGQSGEDIEFTYFVVA
jgi:hypothetical protein